MSGPHGPSRRNILTSIAAATGALALPGLARGQSAYPNRPVRIVVPFPPGGNIDVTGRIAANLLGDALKQQFIVENRVGGGGIVGTEAVTRAEPDGYTLLWGATNVICIVPATGKVPYDPQKDLMPVSALGMSPQVLVVNGKIPVKTLGEFVEWAKTQPKQQSYGGGGGPGSASNLMMSLLMRRAGIEMIGVSYRGTALALNDLIAGHIPVTFVPISEAVAQADNPAVRPLAITSAKRSERLPNVPAVAETYPGYNATSWTGLFAPAGTPNEIIAILSKVMMRAGNDPQFVADLVKRGVEPLTEGPEKFAEMIAADMPLWAEAVKIAGVKRK